MAIFSKTCEYGLRAVLFIAQATETGTKVGVKEIAKNINSPVAFLAKILQSLSKKGLIKSVKGPNGGFYIPEEASEMSLATVVLAIDGDNLFSSCAMGLRACSSKAPCPLHNEFSGIRNKITQMLKKTTVAEFNKELSSGKFKLFLE